MVSKILKKLLVVDDDTDVLTIVKYALKKNEGLEVMYAISGEQCLEMAKSFIPDLILLDIMMPKMDGHTTLKKLKEIEALRGIPVVFFTAKLTKQELDDYLHEGIVGIISKPFDPLKFDEILQENWQNYLKKRIL